MIILFDVISPSADAITYLRKFCEISSNRHDLYTHTRNSEAYRGATNNSAVCECVGIEDLPESIEVNGKILNHTFHNVREVCPNCECLVTSLS